MSLFPAPAGLLVVALALTAGCASKPPATVAPEIPLDEFCLEAQRVVVRTGVRPVLVVHEDFDAFVKSKAIIDPLTIQQYIWYEDDDRSRPVMVSCKLKSADHLNEALGEGTAAGNGQCQDMNRLTYDRVRARLGAVNVQPVFFDPAEVVMNDANPGPEWLKPFELTSRSDSGVLTVRSKGFRVDWTDQRYAKVPARFRGVQYCHLVAPDYFARLVTGKARPGISVGRAVQASGPAPTDQATH